MAAPAAAAPAAASRAAAGTVVSQDPEQIWSEAVTTNVLFRHLSWQQQKALRMTSRQIKVRQGTQLYKQGSYADSFYVVCSGRFEATEVDGRTGDDRFVREYGRCDSFGSYELLFPRSRVVTITAIEVGSVWQIEKRNFIANNLRDPPHAPMPDIIDLIRSVQMFAMLDDAHVGQLSRAAQERVLPPSHVLCSEGEEASAIHIVKDGALVGQIPGSGMQFSLQKPGLIGESALYRESELRVRKATVAASSSGATVVAFEVSEIEALIGYVLQEQAARTYNRKLFCSVRIDNRLLTEGLPKEQIDILVDALHEQEYIEGFNVAAEDSVDGKLRIVKRGSASVYTASTGEVAQLGPGDFFGEMCLLGRAHRRTASIVARGPGTLTLLELEAKVFLDNEQLEGLRQELLAMPITEDKQPPPSAASPQGNGSSTSPTAGARGGGGPPKPKRRASYAERIADMQAVVARTAAMNRRQRRELSMQQRSGGQQQQGAVDVLSQRADQLLANGGEETGSFKRRLSQAASMLRRKSTSKAADAPSSATSVIGSPPARRKSGKASASNSAAGAGEGLRKKGRRLSAQLSASLAGKIGSPKKTELSVRL